MIEITPESPPFERLRYIVSLCDFMPVEVQLTLQMRPNCSVESVRGKRITGKIFAMPGGARPMVNRRYALKLEGGGVIDLELRDIATGLFVLEEYNLVEA